MLRTLQEQGNVYGLSNMTLEELNFPSNDILLASAARFLIDGYEENAASILLSCTVEVGLIEDSWSESALQVIIKGPRAAYDVLSDINHPINQAVYRAFEALTPAGIRLYGLVARATWIEIDANWRTELLEIARGNGVHNQGVAINEGRIITWKNLRFRSQSEIRIAQALEKAGVLFLPNCTAHLRGLDGSENKEADFLVCHRGKWGILEVDGEPFHPPSRTVHDHERDRLFHTYGITLVQHYDASACFNEPGSVVGQFLDLLSKV